MNELYSEKMLRLENLFNSWMLKAEQLYMNNDFQPTKEQCQCLQQAASCQGEMARISSGQERLYHQRRLKEINAQIGEIVAFLTPKKAEEAPKASENENTTQAKTSSGDALDDEVKGWFQPIPANSFDDVVGMEDVKKKLRHCIKAARMQELYDRMKIRKLQSYFFVGPPGCGKTFIVKAFAHELASKDYKYLALVGSDILSKYVGDAEKTITRLFEEAEKNAPCIVFIDEIDGVCKSRATPGLPEYASSLTTSFLTGYNHINESNKPIIFIGATNYPTQVDSAMLDRVELIYIPFPDEEARTMKFRQELDGIVTLEDGFTFEEMSQLTGGENTRANYRDIVRLCDQLKLMLIDIAMDSCASEAAAVEALDQGTIQLTRVLFAEAQAKYMRANRKSKAKELQQWEEEMKESMDE